MDNKQSLDRQSIPLETCMTSSQLENLQKYHLRLCELASPLSLMLSAISDTARLLREQIEASQQLLNIESQKHQSPSGQLPTCRRCPGQSAVQVDTVPPTLPQLPSFTDLD